MNTRTCVLLTLAFVLMTPLAAADPDVFTSGDDVAVEGICVDVDIFKTPPVAVYECPWTKP